MDVSQFSFHIYEEESALCLSREMLTLGRLNPLLGVWTAGHSIADVARLGLSGRWGDAHGG